MKHKAWIYLFAALVIVIILAGVSLLAINWLSVHEFSNNKEVEGPVRLERLDSYHVAKRDGFIFFNITQTKPSSCHIITFHKTDFDDKIVLDLNISKYTDNCASDNRFFDTVSGEIEIEDPESVEIRVDGKRVYYTGFSNTGDSLPEGYTLDSYTIENVTGVPCSKNSDCRTPMEYLIQSRCPFTSLCLDGACTVVCPGAE